MASPSAHEPAPFHISSLTVAALGVLAYVAETLLHELAGHGSACLLSGGKITLLAPLYMRCSVETVAMVAAGPAMNLFAGLLCFIALRVRRPVTGAFRYFLWLSLCFNLLVAAGYLLTGAATGFGDWPIVFANVQPPWMWRAPAGVAGIVAYWVFLRIAGATFTRIAGTDGAKTSLLILLPTTAAAIVALAAEAYGQGAQPLGLALAFGCTLLVGLTLIGIVGKPEVQIANGAVRIPFNSVLIVFSLLVAAAFILVVGPGADLSRL